MLSMVLRRPVVVRIGERKPQFPRLLATPSPHSRRVWASLAEVPALNPDLLPDSIRGWVVDLADRFQSPWIIPRRP